MIYATIGDKCICLNDSSTINSLFRKQEGDTRMFLHAKHASSRFREVIVHTPGTDALVLALGYVYSLNCELLINTGVKGKYRIISIYLNYSIFAFISRYIPNCQQVEKYL